jgi:hypothetical protein
MTGLKDSASPLQRTRTLSLTLTAGATALSLAAITLAQSRRIYRQKHDRQHRPTR